MSKNNIKIKRHLFVCDCGDPSHQFITSYYPNDTDWNELSIEIYLNQSDGFWKRLLNGFKYVFGYKSRFGAFDNILLNVDDARKLKDAINEYIVDVTRLKSDN